MLKLDTIIEESTVSPRMIEYTLGNGFWRNAGRIGCIFASVFGCGWAWGSRWRA